MQTKDIININNKIVKLSKAGKIDKKEVSDSHHCFGDLYKQRMVLFCIVCSSYPKLSWKSKKHYDDKNDPMFEGDFIAGINTPLGPATYHFKLKYWDYFDINEIERAPQYDGHSSDEDLDRLISLVSNIDKRGGTFND